MSSNKINGQHDYAVTILVQGMDSVIFPTDPWPYGQYEFSRREDPFPLAEGVLKRELLALAEPPERPPLRVRTYVTDVVDDVEAVRVARDHGNETLAIMQLDFLYSYSPVLSSIGYVVDLQTGRASSLPPSGRPREGGTLALLDEVAFNPTATLSLLLATDPRHFGELGSALRRSAHWRNVAKASTDRVQYVLMTWMACEVLCKVSQDDDVSARVLASVGFLRDRNARWISVDDRLALKTNRAKVEYWRRTLWGLVDRCRKLRNAIVHAGYRDIEMATFLSTAEFETLKRFLAMAVPRLQGLAVVGLQLGMRRVSDIWTQLDKLFYTSSDARIANDLLGTIIYSLENPMPFDLVD